MARCPLRDRRTPAALEKYRDVFHAPAKLPACPPDRQDGQSAAVRRRMGMGFILEPRYQRVPFAKASLEMQTYRMEAVLNGQALHIGHNAMPGSLGFRLEKRRIPLAPAENPRLVFHQIDYRGRLEATITAINNQIHLLTHTIPDIFGIG